MIKHNIKRVQGTGRKAKLLCDIRKMRGVRVFDPSKARYGARIASEPMLARAKEYVLEILEKNKKQHAQTGKPTVLEQAFLDASGEKVLRFAYGRRMNAVRNAKFTKKRFMGKFRTDHGYADRVKIELNEYAPYTEKDLQIVLLHEALHYFAGRARPGNPDLTEEVEHHAMSLLGDRDEQIDYFHKHWNVDILHYSSTVAQRKRRRTDPNWGSKILLEA